MSKRSQGDQESLKGIEIIDCQGQLVGHQGEARLPLLLASGRLSWTPHECKGCFGGVRGEVTTSCTVCEECQEE